MLLKNSWERRSSWYSGGQRSVELAFAQAAGAEVLSFASSTERWRAEQEERCRDAFQEVNAPLLSLPTVVVCEQEGRRPRRIHSPN